MRTILAGVKPSRAAALFILALFLLNGCARAPRPPMGITSPPATRGSYHTVARGETLYRISKQYQVDVAELMRINNIYSPASLATGQRLFIPGVYAPAPVEVAVPQNIRQLVGPAHELSNWRTITVHHSATSQGSARAFDRDHRRRHMGGLFYHFVIGNGTSTGDGQLETGWRWKRQVKANRPNDIQICLVGNFEKEYVSGDQFKTLVDLIRLLRDQYAIPLSGIRRHNDIKGKPTECPGRHFPFDKLIAQLANGS